MGKIYVNEITMHDVQQSVKHEKKKKKKICNWLCGRIGLWHITLCMPFFLVGGKDMPCPALYVLLARIEEMAALLPTRGDTVPDLILVCVTVPKGPAEQPENFLLLESVSISRPAGRYISSSMPRVCSQ